MLPYSLGFRSPGYLLLLALLPLLWWFSFRSLAGLGSLRRLFALALRTLVLVAVVLALAEVQWVRTEERLTVIYLLDVSQSIPVARRMAMSDYVNKSISKHREKQDRAGVIAFGREAAIEIPPFDEFVPLNERVETPIDDESTNLAGALKLAQATFKEDTAKRIVIVSDGKQNIGDALEQARSVAEAGIGIDTQPVTYEARADLLVDKLTIPPDVRKGQPFDLRVVISNTTVPGPGESGVIGATLVITRKTDDQPVGISEQHIEVPPGKQVYTVRQELDNPHFYTYEARVVPDDPTTDALQQNNRATIFTHVRGKGQVLLIEDHESRGQHEFLVERLRAENLEVQVRPSDNLPTSLAELQPFDTIVLAN
ncbi:MAG TPA: VWA domain-containing protein, partial [Pirellulales bacterium]|nr:VWA domain-containing protein [Pirellulales bacterium]